MEEDSKIYPYFHLDALYREKSKVMATTVKLENMVAPLMVLPELLRHR